MLGRVSMAKEQRAVCSGGLVVEVEAAVRLGLKEPNVVSNSCLRPPVWIGELLGREGIGVESSGLLDSVAHGKSTVD